MLRKVILAFCLLEVIHFSELLIRYAAFRILHKYFLALCNKCVSYQRLVRYIIP